ncbi:L,D-transpeptidase family protein [Sphingomonas sp.]|jgi:lipoprotein-anchoring transpeptidase ErfK/SrfK|uniref:L,D-transpeptidase family protein n=1 Tax=Sphingomonas sp. TaxID=28214 RepID=UPI002D7FF531|nr:L,D-transpeptidase family protein [Sphingomonas sp.]HEU0045932.1 L,D-transpeptidase family protein [Sphingomonas sp.]
MAGISFWSAAAALAALVIVPAHAPTAKTIRPAPRAQPAPEALIVRRVLPIGPIKFGAHHWDEAGAPSTGQVVITVDLAAQVLSVFRDGYEIGAAAILYGDDEKPTPLGRFPITQKDADHVSNLYGAPMPYMLRMTNDGISVHGTSVEWGYATHGCIGVPVPFAKKLFGAVKLGDVVIVTRGKALALGQPITA